MHPAPPEQEAKVFERSLLVESWTSLLASGPCGRGHYEVLPGGSFLRLAGPRFAPGTSGTPQWEVPAHALPGFCWRQGQSSGQKR